MFGDVEKILKEARKGKYGVAAFNINSLDSVIATISGAEKEGMPIFLQVHKMCEDYVGDIDTYLKALRIYIEKSSTEIILHHDHCGSFEEIKEAVDRGFQSVMFDGSALPFEENVKKTKKAVEYAHKYGVLLEAELGSIPAMEAVSFDDSHDRFTEPDKVKEFIERTGCDLLAISVGTAHGGVHCETHLPFHFDKLEAIVQTVSDYPFVLHGGASIPKRLIDQVNRYGARVDEKMHICSEDDIAKACSRGIAKVNMDVDNWMAFTAGVRRALTENPEVYDPMTYLSAGRTEWEKEVRHKIKNLKKYKEES